MALRFSVGTGSLGEENLILLTGLKETFKPKRERISEVFLLRTGEAFILFHVLLIILVISVKQEDG